MSEETSVFQSGNSMAVRLIGDCRLPAGTRVREVREGGRIIIEPILDSWSPEVLKAAGALEGTLPRPDLDGLPRDPFDR